MCCPGPRWRLARGGYISLYRSWFRRFPDRLPRNGQGVLSVSSRVGSAGAPARPPAGCCRGLPAQGRGGRTEGSRAGAPSTGTRPQGRTAWAESRRLALRRDGQVVPTGWRQRSCYPAARPERRPAQLRPRSSRNRLGCQPTGRRRPAANMRACEVRYGALGAVGPDNPSRRRFIGHERSA